MLKVYDKSAPKEVQNLINIKSGPRGGSALVHLVNEAGNHRDGFNLLEIHKDGTVEFVRGIDTTAGLNLDEPGRLKVCFGGIVYSISDLVTNSDTVEVLKRKIASLEEQNKELDKKISELEEEIEELEDDDDDDDDEWNGIERRSEWRTQAREFGVESNEDIDAMTKGKTVHTMNEGFAKEPSIKVWRANCGHTNFALRTGKYWKCIHLNSSELADTKKAIDSVA